MTTLDTAVDAEHCVWLSISHIKSDLSFGFTSEMLEHDEQILVTRLLAFKRGELLTSNEVPASMWIALRARSKDDRRSLPDLFVAGGFLAVSEAFAEVLREFDLGRTRLHPVELLHADKETPFPGRRYLLNIAEVRRHFSPEHSLRYEAFPHSTTSFVGSVGNAVVDGDISVNPDALGGPDLWIDDTLVSHFFCSDRLVRALRAANVASRVPLHRCRVVALN